MRNALLPLLLIVSVVTVTSQELSAATGYAPLYGKYSLIRTCSREVASL